jgi:2-hydroxy-6-oxonona-2,4-dienedioate hydrolase
MSGRHRSRKQTLASVAAVAVGYTLIRYGVWHLTRRRQKRDGRLGRLESRWTVVRGLRIHSRASDNIVPPDRPTVVLVHGLGVSSRYMMPIAEHLALDFQVFAPDLPGFGLSDKPSHILTIRELADALALWMKSLAVTRAAFVGNSLGNEIIVELALRRPEKVISLVLQGPTPEPAARNAPQQIWRYIATSPFEQPPLGWISATDYMLCGIRRFVRTFHYMLQDRIEEKLPKVQAPTLVVRGERDRIVSQRWAEEVARLLPNARLVVIPGAAHAINFSYPAAFRSVLVPFLCSKPPARL